MMALVQVMEKVTRKWPRESAIRLDLRTFECCKGLHCGILVV
jgi:hypothetical protein